MKWTSPPGYSPDKDEFDQLDDYAGRWRLTVIALLVVVLLIATFSLVRYVADCTQHPQLGVLKCAAAWAYGLMP